MKKILKYLLIVIGIILLSVLLYYLIPTDLVIKSVTYKNLSGCRLDQPGGVVCESNKYEYNIEVLNQGHRPVKAELFISTFPLNEQKIEKGSSHTSYIQGEKEVLWPGESTIFTTKRSFFSDAQIDALKFIVNNNKEKRFPRLQIIKETNYDNNTFILPFAL